MKLVVPKITHSPWFFPLVLLGIGVVAYGLLISRQGSTGMIWKVYPLITLLGGLHILAGFQPVALHPSHGWDHRLGSAGILPFIQPIRHG